MNCAIGDAHFELFLRRPRTQAGKIGSVIYRGINALGAVPAGRRRHGSTSA